MFETLIMRLGSDCEGCIGIRKELFDEDDIFVALIGIYDLHTGAEVWRV